MHVINLKIRDTILRTAHSQSVPVTFSQDQSTFWPVWPLPTVTVSEVVTASVLPASKPVPSPFHEVSPANTKAGIQ